MQKKLSAYLAEYEKTDKFSGLVQILKKGEVIFKEYVGYADREKGIPFSDDTKFRLYSMTKALTAISVMRLYEQGKVDLSAHPRKYIACAEKVDDRVTVEMLLHHISGLPEIASAESMTVERAVNLHEEVEKIAKEPLLFTPGEGTRYTNTNYILLSLIAEEFYKMPIHEYLEKVLFPEMGMHTACCDVDGHEIENLAMGYNMEDDEVSPATEYVNRALISGAGCSVGTIRDVEALHDVVKHRKILAPETWDVILTKCDINSFGMGCMVYEWNGKLVYQHNGGHVGFRLMHRYFPEEDFAIFILSNAGYGNARVDIPEKIYELWFGSSDHADLPEMDKGFATK